MKRVLFLFLLVFVIGCQAGPWDLRELRKTPAMTWGSKTGLVQQVYYSGEPLNGKPTRIFAYVGRPADTKARHPAVVLVHGGGGKAFPKWVEHWAERGYVAIAMDTSGNGPDGRLEDGAPDQSDQSKFRDFSEADIKNMWTYHAVAAVVRGHSLLASLPEVDPNRIAITGISWGGYLTCIVAGLDHRLKAAVPVYGCGFLGEDSVWKDSSLAQMTPEARALWLKNFDPSQYLTGVACPILFLNGTHDFAYPLGSYQKSYRLVKPGLRHTSVVTKLPHGHIWTFAEPDQFIDRALQHKSFPKLTNLAVVGDNVRASSSVDLKEAAVNWTLDQGPWQKREWQSAPATLSGKNISAKIPMPSESTIVLLMGTTKDGLRISSEYAVAR